MSRFVYQGVLQDGNGARLESGNVAVLLAGTSTPASIYAAATGGVAVAAVTTASDGSWSFYIDESDYAGTQRFDVVMSKSGYLSITLEDIAVLPPSSHVGLTVKDATDITKVGSFSASSITTATTRTYTLPDFDGGAVVADHGGTVTKIIKFLVSGATAAKTMIVASAHTDDRTQTLPDKTGTIANLDGDTFTNTILTDPTLNGDLSAGSGFIDDDSMGTASATTVASSESIKAHTDAHGAVQKVYNIVTAVVNTGAVEIPFDDTIPQSSEGGKVLEQAITPTNASNLLCIKVWGTCARNAAGDAYLIGAFFQDATAGAIAASVVSEKDNLGTLLSFSTEFIMVAGTTSATTFKFHIGSDTSSTLYLNGATGGTRVFGGVSNSGISITEMKA